MSSTQIFRQAAYNIHCTAEALEDGRYRPALTVARVAWPSRPRVIEVPRSTFGSEDLAIAAAHSRGLAWVADHG